MLPDLQRDVTRARELLEDGEYGRLLEGAIGRLARPVADEYRIRRGLSELARARDPSVRAVERALRCVHEDGFLPYERSQLAAVEERRQALAADETPVEYHLHGPSDEGLTEEVYEGYRHEVRVSDFPGAKPEYGPLLYALARELDPDRVLELGTCLGISGAYIAGGFRNDNRLLTVEGGEPQVGIARETFAELGVSDHTTVRHDRFQDVLLEGGESPRFEMAFLDGHHNHEATLEYFEALYELADPGAVVVFDDVVGYSEGMDGAWRTIAADPRVELSVTTERYGIAVLKAGIPEKRDFSVPV
ncbi:O-methyltransferase [Saliphagus sp. LR7]|uniref:O-methyltransferase n=1 Tax=Saliphagus sp. LR7 TaxID=2282654 RepID=UPI000DF78F81|nr:class I SAM-dependent methyltransferase [Saliphagus sp. LR7]